jgi:hypothetical protein
MTELALHILDIVQNSISAKASFIEITIHEDIKTDLLTIEITDNGNGMNEKELQNAFDPYFTTRTTRKVGLGLPLFKQAAELCSGSFFLESEPGKGTKVKASMQYSHIDRQPLGDLAGTIALLVSSNPAIDFIYDHTTNKGQFLFDTRAVKSELGHIPITHPKVTKFIREMIQENLEDLNN